MNWNNVISFITRFWFFILVGAFFLIGIIFSVKLEIIGIILACGWCLNYLVDFLIRKAEILLRNQEVKRDRHQTDWNAGNIADTPAERKALKDEYDKVRSLDWALSRNMWLKHLINAFAAYIFCLTMLFSGPGRIISWTLDELFGVGRQQIVKLTNKPMAQQGLQEMSESWSKDKKLFLQNLLIKEKGLSAEKYVNIMKHKNFSLNHVIDFAKTSNALGDDLYDEISLYLNDLVIQPTPSAPAVTLAQKSWWQQKREEQWILLFIIEIIFTLILLFYVAACLVATALQIIFSFSDEAWDQIKERLATAMAKRSGIATVAPGATSAGTPSGEILHSIIGSTISEFLVKIFLRERR